MVNDTSYQRRIFLKRTGAVTTGASLTGLAGCTSSGEGDQIDYPTDNIRLIVAGAAGGGYDAYARLAEPYWEQYFPNQPTVNVENVGPPAQGTALIYASDPDGYTFGHADQVSAVAAQVGSDPDFDLREMSYIGAVSRDPPAIATPGRVDIADWDELVDQLPDLSIATQGQGAYAHVLTLALAQSTDEISFDDMHFVHYSGTGDALSGLERGEADLIVVGLTSAVSVAEALEGAIPVAFTSPDVGAEVQGADEFVHNYSTNLNADLSEFAEIGVTQRLYVGPPGVPDEVLEIQRDTLEQIINDEDFVEEAREAGRPILQPVIGEDAREHLEMQFDAFGSGKLGDAIRDSF